MSTIVSKLKAAQIALRKRKAVQGEDFSSTSQFELTVLTSLLGTMELAAKDRGLSLDQYPDSDVTASIRKFIKSSGEMSGYSNEPVVQERSAAEIAILTTFLPEQLTPDEIADIIGTLVLDPENNSIGAVMRFFKENHAGLYDPKLVNEQARNII